MSFFGVNKKAEVSTKLRAQRFLNLQASRHQTDQLEAESRQMADRLQELKLAMSREKNEREGGFWKTGQKGALNNYAHDVLAKPNKSSSADKKKKPAIKVIQDEPLVLPIRDKGPGTIAFIAQRAGSNKENERGRGAPCGQCEQKNAHVTCLECGEDYCARCFATFHLKGALKKHRSVPLGSSASRTPRGGMNIATTVPSTNGVGSARRETRSPAAGLRETAATPSDVTFSLGQSDSTLSSTRSSASHSHRYQLSGRHENGVSTNGVAGGTLLDGQYDEGAAAADFQKALNEWRLGRSAPEYLKTKPRRPVSPVHSPTVQIDEGIGTDAEISVPVAIEFTSSLTYAEKLLLKRNRRTELEPLGPYIHNGNIIQSARPETAAWAEQNDEPRVQFEALYDAMSGASESPVGDLDDRPQSCVSIVPIDNIVYPASTEQTAEYWVEEVMDDPAGDEQLTESDTAQGMMSAVDITGASDLDQMTMSKHGDLSLDLTGFSQEPYSAKKSTSTKQQMSTKQPPLSAKRPASGRTKTNASSSSTQSEVKGQPVTSRASSRASSRLNGYGGGHLTMEPSAELQAIASLARQLTSEMVVSSGSKLGLGTFFTAGVEPDSTVDRTLTPTKHRRVGESRPGSSRSRPVSAREDSRLEPKYKLSNKVYQMSGASWKPSSSLADTVSDDQARQIVQDDFHTRCWTPRHEDDDPTDQSSWTGLPWTDDTAIRNSPRPEDTRINAQLVQPHPPSTLPASARSTRTPRRKVLASQRPPSASQRPPSASQRSLSTMSSARPPSGVQRESSLIVVDGEDMSKYDDNKDSREEDENDREYISHLEWELASHRSNASNADGQISQMSARDDEDLDSIDSDDEMFRSQLAIKAESLENQLRESQLMDDFDEMEARFADEDDVLSLHG